MTEDTRDDRELQDEEQVNPDFHADRMDLRAKDDMRSRDEVRDPESRRLSDVDPMGGEHVREDDSARSDMRMRDETRVQDDARSRDDVRGTASTGKPTDRMGQMEMWPDMGDLRQRFDSIQSEFIDDPRSAVSKAEQLINDVIERITRSMHNRVDSMHRDVDKNADTEQLRQTMRGYRDLVAWMEQRRAA